MISSAACSVSELVKRTFWFFASVFCFILVNNYMGLIPGVGTVGRIRRATARMVGFCAVATPTST